MGPSGRLGHVTGRCGEPKWCPALPTKRAKAKLAASVTGGTSTLLPKELSVERLTVELLGLFRLVDTDLEPGGELKAGLGVEFSLAAHPGHIGVLRVAAGNRPAHAGTTVPGADTYRSPGHRCHQAKVAPETSRAVPRPFYTSDASGIRERTSAGPVGSSML